MTGVRRRSPNTCHRYTRLARDRCAGPNLPQDCGELIHSWLLQISLLENGPVVFNMPGKNVCQGSNCEWISAGNAGSHPGLSREISKKVERCQSNCLELLNMAGPGNLIGFRSAGGDVLVVTRQGAVETAAEPECAEHKQPLAVVDMA